MQDAGTNGENQPHRVSEFAYRAVGRRQEVALHKGTADGVGQQNVGDQLELARISGFISRD
jgi:hypothetical protein